MSRTYRKRLNKPSSFEWFHSTRSAIQIPPTKKQVAMHYSDNDYSGFKLPKPYRKIVNRQRSAVAKQELHRYLTIEGYEEQCSSWNCKDTNHWIYF